MATTTPSGLFSRKSFKAETTLDTISGYLKNPNASEESKIWNYGRYAYISLSTIAENNAGLCAPTAGTTLGDTPLSGSSTYQSLISRDGERDIPSKPILDSVRISNDGSTDMSDAALFDIDVSFKCFSESQFETYEEAFFRVGNGVKLSFGYKGLSTTGMNGSLTANVYNFSFSLDANGVYSCNLKLTGKNRFAAVLGIKQELAEKGTEVTDEDGNVTVAKSILGDLIAGFTNAFPTAEESGPVTGPTTIDFVKDGEAIAKDGFALANIQTKSGGDATILGFTFDFDDKFVKYVSFEKLVEVINKCHSKSNFKWGFGTRGGKVIDAFASADPSKLLLDGEMANYGSSDDDDTKNELQTSGTFSGHHKDMFIAIDFVSRIFNDLIKKENEEKDSKGDSSINNFLRVLFTNIKDLTGGLYQLSLYNDGLGNKGEFLIVNERAEHDSVDGSTTYEFTLHEIGSVTKAVSMQSNFDSDLAAAALVANRGGEVPTGALDNLYKDCGGVQDDVKPEVDPPTLADVEAKKLEIGLGLSDDRILDFKNIMASYVSTQPKDTGTDTGYRYMIDLSVTTYGTWGAQIGDSFTFSGVPKKYKGSGKYFCLGKIEHTFDGQGGWEAQYTGFLKLDTQ